MKWVASLSVAAAVVAFSAWHYGSPDNPSAKQDLTVLSLRMPADGFPNVVEIETKSEAIDNYPEGTDVPGMVLLLRNLGITSTAYYRYHLMWNGKGNTAKVKINVFRSAEVAHSDFLKRYGEHVISKSTPVSFGDGGFRFGDRMIAFRHGRAQIEVSAKNAPDLLLAFTEKFAVQSSSTPCIL